MQTISFSSTRLLIICSSINECLKLVISKPFAILISVNSSQERIAIDSYIKSLIDLGCVEFCSVGLEAGKMHDSIDWIIVDSALENPDFFNILTTDFMSVEEACNYSVLVAGGKPRVLLVVTNGNNDITKVLKRTIENR